MNYFDKLKSELVERADLNRDGKVSVADLTDSLNAISKLADADLRAKVYVTAGVAAFVGAVIGFVVGVLI